MYSKKICWLAPVLWGTLGLSIFSGCGIFGKKEEAPTTVVSPGTDLGCFDELGDRMTRYSNGTISEAEWKGTFECVDDALKTFELRVRGEFPTGYSEADVRALLTQFIIRAKPVNAPLVRGLFALKTSIFGGDPNIIEKQWIREVRSLLAILRDYSTKNLELFRERAREKSPEVYIRFVKESDALGQSLNVFFKKFTGNKPIDRETWTAFLKEALKLADIREGWVDDYGELMLTIAGLISQTSSAQISEKVWGQAFGIGLGLGVGAYVYSVVDEIVFREDDSKTKFFADLLLGLQPVLQRFTDLYRGTISTERIAEILAAVPTSFLSPDRKSAALYDLPKILGRTIRMGTGIPGGLSQAFFDHWTARFQHAAKVLGQTKRIFENQPDVISKVKYQERMQALIPVTPENERAFLRESGLLANRYLGLYDIDGDLMKLGADFESSLTFNQIEHFFWYREIVLFLFDRYLKPAGSPGATRVATVEDLEAIISDVLNILRGWKKAHPLFDAKQLAAKRYREANLFMPSSNGNDNLDETELVYYLAFLYSSGALSSSIYNKLKDDKLCDASLKDELGTDAFAPSCFRSNYFEHPEIFLTNLPKLLDFLVNLLGKDKVEVPKAIESAARRQGYTEDPLGLYDIDSISGLHHYVESLFMKFDLDRDQRLSNDELIDYAFPVFKRELSVLSGVKQDFLLKPTLTYLVYYGKVPTTTDLLVWMGYSVTLKIRATRANVYNLLALLSAEASK